MDFSRRYALKTVLSGAAALAFDAPILASLLVGDTLRLLAFGVLGHGALLLLVLFDVSRAPVCLLGFLLSVLRLLFGVRGA